MDISIVILNYKSKGFALNCIKSIKEADFNDLRYEVIVVDNNSEDYIGEILGWQYPDIIFIQNKKNIGMGSGNNVGIRKASGKYVVIMNPDTLAYKDTFKKLFEFMEADKQIGVVGPKQLNPDGSIQDSCFSWHSIMTPIYRRTPLGNTALAKKDFERFLMKNYDGTYPINVDWLLGSFLFCRKEALNGVGLFDENFFLYFEDTDLCRRFWQKKWRVVYNPEVQIIHNHTRQSAQIAWYKFFVSKATRNHITSWIRYMLKWGTAIRNSERETKH